MTYFLSKKKKEEVKSRRKKKKLAELHAGVISQKSQSEQIPTKRRRVDEIGNDDFPLVPKIPEIPSNVIRIPAGLSAKDTKKFRKDERRKARNNGHDDSLLKFKSADVEEGTEPKLPSTQKRKRDFPRINDLLEQKKIDLAKREAGAAKEKADNKLPQEYKDRHLAIDCEMVGIGTDGKTSALARVSITRWSGDVVMDTFVKVPGKVTDFRTWVSGVEAKHLKSSDAMEVTECRKQVAKILKGKILIGHSLKNDFDALMLNHPKADIRDTAKYRPLQRLGGRKWRARKLKDIVKEHAGITIQEEGQAHDSVDDARATMELFKCVRAAWERDLETTRKKRNK